MLFVQRTFKRVNVHSCVKIIHVKSCRTISRIDCDVLHDFLHTNQIKELSFFFMLILIEFLSFSNWYYISIALIIIIYTMRIVQIKKNIVTSKQLNKRLNNLNMLWKFPYDFSWGVIGQVRVHNCIFMEQAVFFKCPSN